MRYRERLSVPVLWWLLAAGFALSLLVGIGAYLGPVWGIGAAAATRRRSGVEADARAHLVLRPYVATSVEITLADPADPVPYWLVSSRRPEALASALTEAIGPRPAENDAVA